MGELYNRKGGDKQVLADFTNFDKAAQFLDAALSGKYRVIIYGGAIRGGKSFNSVAILVLLHRMYPGSRSCITRDTWKTMKRNVYPTCRKAIPSNFITKFNGTDYYWTFSNGSEMFFYPENYDTDKEMRQWDGLEVNFILLEQAEGLRNVCFEKALERSGSHMLSTGKQPPPLVLVTMNPNSTWARKFHDDWRNNLLPENWLYIPAKIDDNPHIDQSYKDSLQELKKTNPVKYLRYVEGDWDAEEDSDDRLVSNLDIDNTFRNAFVPLGKPVVSSDIAFEGSDRFVIIRWRGWVIENITVIAKSKGNEVVDEIKHAANVHKTANSDIGFDADGVGSGIGGFIPGAKEFKSRKPPIKDDGFESVKDEAAWHLASIIKSNGLFISQACYQYTDSIREELKVLRKKKDAGYNSKLSLIKKDEMKSYLSGKSPDILDAMIIRAWMALMEDKESMYYAQFNPETNVSAEVKYNPRLPIQIGLKLNKHFHINAVVVQIDTQSGQFNCIKAFVLKSPRNTIDDLAADILEWVKTLPEFSTFGTGQSAYYARPFTESEADEDHYAQSMQRIGELLKPIKAKHKGLMLAKKTRIIRTLTNKLLADGKIKISKDCAELIADFQMVKEAKNGDKEEDPSNNITGPTDALENFLSIHITKF